MGSQYSITDLEKMTGIKPRTIHYYIKERLIPSAAVAGGGAFYNDEHVMRLNLIKEMQRSHLKLSGIREALNGMSVSEMEKLYERAIKGKVSWDSNSLENWIVDTDNPVLTTPIEGSIATDADYQNIADTLVISWSGSDTASGIAMYEYALDFTFSGISMSLVPWTSADTATADTLTGLSLLTEGATYYLSVRATDVAGNISDPDTSDGITIDLTAPAGTTVSDGTGADISYSGSDTTLSANWVAFTETVSGVQKYEYAIGTTSGGMELVSWTDNDTSTSVTKSGLTLSNGTEYYISVRATDNAENVSTTIISDGVIVDTAAPTAGNVTDSTTADLDWTRSTSSLTSTWTGFSDALSGIQKYEYAIGDTIGGTNVLSWTNNSTITSVTKTGLTLTNGTTYYISVRATDNVGNVSTVSTTDGITVDTDAPVLETPFEGSLTADRDYQNSATTLIVSWSGSDTASGIAMYEYAINFFFSGIPLSLVPWTSAETATADTATGLSLVEGTTYYLSVRATDVAGNISSVISADGITIDLTDPIAGSAIDGSNTDISYTGSDSTLTVSWSEFIDPLTGFSPGTHSGIASYQVAVEDGAGNIVMNWTDVGDTSTWTITDLSLSNGIMYHVLVRAVDAAGNLSTSMSTDGVTIDTDGPVARLLYTSPSPRD